MTGRQEPACTVVLCHGCCCGTMRKHPEVDSAEHRRRVRLGVGSHVRVVITDCLDMCKRSTVAVVLPGRQARRRGAHPVWLSEMHDSDDIDELIAWVRAGGPGNSPFPDSLLARRFRPSRRSKVDI